MPYTRDLGSWKALVDCLEDLQTYDTMHTQCTTLAKTERERFDKSVGKIILIINY